MRLAEQGRGVLPEGTPEEPPGPAAEATEATDATDTTDVTATTSAIVPVPMRVALAQINLTIGDFAGNLQKIRDSLARAREQRADLLVLPELGISGYPPGDLLERPSFLRDHTRALEGVRRTLSLHGGHPRRQLLETPQGPGRLGQEALAGFGLASRVVVGSDDRVAELLQVDVHQ